MIATLTMNTDLLNQKEAPVVMVPQNDGACRMLQVQIVAGGVPWTIPEDACVRLSYRKPDGTGGAYDTLEDGSPAWAISGSTVTLQLVPQMFTCTGMVAAKLEFILDGKSLQTFGFWLRIAADHTADAVQEGDYLNWSAWTQTELERMLQEAKDSGAFRGEQGIQGEQGIPGVAQTPLFANSVDECTDTTKVYVLPDGYIYGYVYSADAKPYTNLAGDVKENYRQNTSGVAVASSGAILTGFIPVSKGQTVRVKGFNPTAAPESYPLVCFYTGASEDAVVSETKWGRGDGMFTLNGDVYEWTAFILQTEAEHTLADSITHVRINGTMIEGEEVIVTVDEEIVESSGGGYAWTNTGHLFVPEFQKWSGKKWVAVGDSLTYDEYVTTDAYYHDHIAESTGITVVNMGQGGTGYKRTFDSGEGYAFYQRILNVPTDADVITIFGSGNDLSTTWETYGLGEATDTGTDTICGCINTTLDNLFSIYPTANVGIITPTPWKAFYPSAVEADGKAYRMTQLCEKLIEICRMRSIPCLDLYHCSGTRPWDKAFRDAFYTKDDVESDGELGGVHLDENGHKIIATKIKAFLEMLLG